jgi:hypothetical protein
MYEEKKLALKILYSDKPFCIADRYDKPGQESTKKNISTMASSLKVKYSPAPATFSLSQKSLV